MPKLRYETGLAILMGATFGVVMFDRSAINILSPYIVEDLGLTNAQIGVAASILALSWAVGGFLAGRITDIAGRRKPLLIVAVIAFSACSMASGLVGGFLSLALVRLLMGLAEGPVPALGFTSVIEASGDKRRGRNIGVMSLAGGMLGLLLSPIVLVAWAEQVGWRGAFFIAGVPGLVLALVIAFYMREPRRPAPTADHSAALKPGSVINILANRNVLVSAAIAVLIFAFVFIITLFVPLYFARERGFTPADIAVPWTIMMAAGIVAGIAVPAMSDRLGRKPVVLFCCFTGVVLPAVCLTPIANPWLLGIACLPAALAVATPNVIVTIVPGESVSPADRGAALGLVMGAAEVFGGFGGPALAGFAADQWGLGVTMYIAGGCILAAASLTLLLRETAPRRLAASRAAAPAAAAI